MTEPDRDPCDELLTPGPTPADLEPLRGRILQRTLPALRRRRWLRRLAWAAALAACYAAGVLTLGLRPAPPPTEQGRREQPPDPPPTPAAVEDRSARAREWQALETPERRAALYREAADRYLAEDDDVTAALRCYGASLDHGGGEALETKPDDSWLLLAIKDARQREKNDAKNGS
jgi:hypothetical protein